MKNREDLTTRVQAIITMGERVLATETKGFQQQTFVNEQQFHDFRISGLSFLSRVFGDTSQYYQCFKSEVTSPGASRTKRGLGILSAAITELKENWVETTRGAITSEILTEFLTMAKIHLDAGNLHGAVTLVGAVIVKHLRSLCLAGDISPTNRQSGTATPKKPLQLTGDAYKKKLYDRELHKKIISWLELCDSAARDTAKEISVQQVKDMHGDVSRFLVDTPY